MRMLVGREDVDREWAAAGVSMSLETEKTLEILIVSLQNCTGDVLSQQWAMWGTVDTYQGAGTSENNQHEMIHVHLNTFNWFMPEDTASVRSKSVLAVNSHLTLLPPSMWHRLQFPNVQCNFNTIKSQAYDSQDTFLCPQAPEGWIHQTNKWKYSSEQRKPSLCVKLRPWLLSILHVDRKWAAFRIEKWEFSRQPRALEQEGRAGLHVAGGWNDVM